MNILSLGMTTEDVPGGLNRYYFSLMRELARRGHRVHGFVSGVGEPVSEGSLQIESVGGTGWKKLSRLRERLGHALQQGRYDLANIHFAYLAAPVLALLRHRNVPIVVNFQGPWADELRIERAGLTKSTVARWIEQYVYHRADAFIVLSRAFADLLAARYRIEEQRIHVIPPGVDLNRFRPLNSEKRSQVRRAWGVDADSFVMLLVRHLRHRMGLDEFLTACERLLPENRHVTVLIAGRGPLADDLRRRIAHDARLANVKLLGYVAEERLPDLYAAADLSVVPSAHLEGFGLTILESLASGCPVVGTPVGGIPEVLQQLDPELVAPDATSSDLYDTLNRWVRNPDRLPTPEQCREFAASRYDWSQVASAIEDLFLRVHR